MNFSKGRETSRWEWWRANGYTLFGRPLSLTSSAPIDVIGVLHIVSLIAPNFRVIKVQEDVKDGIGGC